MCVPLCLVEGERVERYVAVNAEWMHGKKSRQEGLYSDMPENFEAKQ